MRISRMFLPTLIFALLCTFATAQQPPNTREAQVAAMKKLSGMIGTWSGSGWTQLGPNDRRESTVTESIQPKLDGLLLVIDGVGKNSTGQIVHQALGVMSYDPDKSGYKFAAYTKEGRSVIADANFEGNNFIWGFDTSRGSIRYTVTLTENEWIEVGERSADKTTWQKFFEMKLKRDSK